VNPDVNAVPEVVSSLDRGLAYGDGLFETIAIREGRPCLWKEHMERLLEGCQRLQIPEPDLQQLEEEALVQCANQDVAVLKLILTRGTGGRGYRAASRPKPWHGFSLHPKPSYPESYRTEGVKVRVCQTRLGRNPVLAGIKHLNRLEQVLARNEWKDEYQEGLMLDTESHVIEGTMSNLFLITRDGLLTADLSQCGIEGVIRQRILAWAGQRGIACKQRPGIGLEDVFAAEALFVCNSIIGIWPVRQLEEMIYSLDNAILHQLLKDDILLCDA
jgi:4-amino-4-deoxychorismate lyase